MASTNFLFENIRWNLKKDVYNRLLGLTSTQAQFCDQVEKLSRRYFPARKRVNTLETEWGLNEIA